MGYNADAAIAKAKAKKAELENTPFGVAVGKIAGTYGANVVTKVTPQIVTDTVTRRYGSPTPTAQQVQSQAEAIASHDTEMDVTAFLNQAISDGVVTSSEAESIFRNTTGGSLFSPQNQQKVTAEASRRINGGTPVWMTRQVQEEFGNYTPEQAKVKLEELYSKEDMTPYDREAFYYLLDKTDSATAKSYFDRAGKMSDEAFADFELEELRAAEMKSYGEMQNDDKFFDIAEKKGKEAKGFYNKYQTYNARKNAIGGKVEELKYRENVLPYINEAKSAQDFDSKKIYSGKAKSNIELYINGGSVYDNEKHPDEGTAMVETELASYRYVTPEERNAYNYYVNTNQPEKAYDFAQKLLPMLNKRAAMATQKDFAELANEFPITANALSVVNNVATAPSAGMEFISQMFTGEDFDPYAPGFRGAIASEAIRGQTAENIENPVWKFIYNTGMSMADSAAVMPMGGAGIAFLATNAAVSEGRRTAIEGGSKAQIFAKGIAAGAFEATFEKIGLDNLFKPRAVGGLAKALQVTLAQGGIEASEELCTSLANNFIDDILMGNESNYKKLVKEYLAKGMSLGEAQYQAMIDMGGEVLTETLAGFVSGVGFGAGGATINYANAANTGKQVNVKGNADVLIDYAKMQDSESTAYKDAVKLSDKKSVKNAEVGALLQQMIIDGQISEADATKLVTVGLDGLPLDEAEQAYYYAGANGVSALEAARMLSDLNVDPERALKAWQKGAEKRTERKGKADTSAPAVTTKYAKDIAKAINETAGATVNPITRKVKPFEVKTEETPVVQNDGNVAETPEVQNAPVKAGKFKGKAYNEATSKYKTAENAKDFEYAYAQGFNKVKPSEDINLEDVAISEAYLAGVSDSRAVVSSRANFEARTPGLNLVDTVSRDVAGTLGDSTRATINNIGKKLGVEIVLTNRTNEIAQGNTKHSRNSSYNFKNGVVTINVDEIHIGLKGKVRSADKLVRFILAHEGTHRLQETSPEAYAEMEKIALSKSNMTLEEYMEKWNISDEAEARGEIVADYFGDLLSSKAEVKALLNENRSLWDKILEVIDWLVYKLKGAGVAYNDILEARELFRQALNEADATVWGEEVRRDFTGEKAVEPHDVLLSRSFVDEHTKLLDEYYDNENAALGLETLKKRYEKIVEIWDKIGGELNSDTLKKWNESKGKDRAFQVFKTQVGYKYNMELSTMCKKGIPLFEAIDTIVKKEVMKELGLKTLGKAEKAILYDILQRKGFDIPCAVCYVEQARQEEGRVINYFLDGHIDVTKSGKINTYKLGWNNVLTEIENEMKAQGISFKFPDLSREAATDIYSPSDVKMDEKTQNAFFEALKKVANKEITRANKANPSKKPTPLIKDFSPENIKKSIGGRTTLNLKIFKTLYEEPLSRVRIDNDLLYSSAVTKNLASWHHQLYTLFNMQGGSGGYKTKQGAVVYWGDILKRRLDPNKVRREGGIRSQSNSDSLMYTLLDQAQALVDATAKGYYIHQYTKVLPEVKVLGLSGVKQNISFIPKVYQYKDALGNVDEIKTKENAGLDKDGNPWFDGIEGVEPKEAFMLLSDKEYSRDNGGICIGFSDKHISKLLDDKRISLVIGFHDSSDDGSTRYKGAEFAKNYNGENEATKKLPDGSRKTVIVGFDQFVLRAENRFKNKDSVTFNGKTYKYDDIPLLAVALYLDHCDGKGLDPAYSIGETDFSTHPNYYKLLANYNLYDSEGHYAPHRKVEFFIPEEVPALDKNGNKTYVKTSEYIKNELAKELTVRDNISYALSDTSSDGVIPRFKEEVEKLRNKTRDDGEVWSRSEDSEYLELAKDPKKNEAKLQEIVDEIAVAKGVETDEDGKPVALYHGTTDFGFTKADVSRSDDSITFWATEGFDIAKTYTRGAEITETGQIGKPKDFNIAAGKNTFEDLEKYNKYAEERNLEQQERYEVIDDSNRMEFAQESMDKTYAEVQKLLKNKKLNPRFTFYMRNFVRAVENKNFDGIVDASDGLNRLIRETKIREYTKEIPEKMIDLVYEIGDVSDWFREGYVKNVLFNRAEHIDDISESGFTGIYKFYFKPGKTYVIDAKLNKWNALPVSKEIKDFIKNEYDFNSKEFTGNKPTTRAVSAWAFKNGYDSVKIENVRDTNDGSKIFGTVWSFKEPEKRLWVADPVTYDDNGEVIPPSERFSDKGDFRWSRSEPEKTFAKGEAPRRDIDVPSEVGGKKVMRGARTTAEAEGINEDYAFRLVEEIRNGNFTYEVSSNKAVALKATNEVNENYDQAKAKWDGIIMSGKRVTPEDIALGEALLVEASHRRNVEETLKINAEVAMLATEAGQVVQAMRILKRLSPSGQLRYLEVVTDRINAERQKTKGKKYSRLIESENEVANANKKYQEADKKVKDLEKKSEEIFNTINQLQNELESEDRIANLEEQKKALIKEVAMLKKELAKESDASGKEKIREQIRILEEDIKENASQLKDALDEKSRLVSERNAMGKELTAIKNAKKATDNAVEKLAGDMALLENEIAELDSQLEKATKFKKELEEELSKLRKERRSIKDKIKRGEESSEKAFAEIEPLENEIAELKEKLEVANTALNEVTEKRNALRNERNKLRDKVKRREGAIERNTSKTKEITNQIAQLLDDLYTTDLALEEAKANRKAVDEKRQKVNELARYAQSKAGKVVLPDDLKAKILQAQNEDELKAAMEIATDYIAANVRTTWAERIRAWRYLAMLGNLRTIFRNLLGNVFMNIPVAAKNVFAYPMELVGVPLNNAIVNANAKRMAEKGISQETIDSYLDRSIAYKTQTLKVFKKRSEDIKKFVKESWDTNLKVAMEGGKYDSTSMADEIESKRVIFKNKAIEAWRKATNWAMESGDLVFVRFNYKQALTRFMLANNLNPETITQAERARAEAYAIKEAQEATFRDKSKLAEGLNNLKKINWATELAFGGLFPFTKTPINVMKRSFEYSPLGIFNMASDIVEAVKGTKNVTDVINSAAKTVSGSALVALGAYLAAQGFLRSTGDDEDEEYDYLAGEQDYAITIGDIRYPIDWASPTAIPLLLGASMYESYFKNDGGVKKKYFIDENGKLQEATAYMNFVDSLNKAMTLFNPVFEATYLSGFADAIETGSQFSSMPGESLIAFGTSSVLSFGKQFVPTAVGQFARIIDPIERRNNEVDQTSGIPRYAQKGVAKIKNSIPWLRETSTPYVDAWGRIPEVKDEAKDYFWSAVENLISPGYYQRVKEDDITKELWRLQKTEDGKGKNVFPDAVGNSYTQTKDKIEYTYVFNPEQKNERQMAESDAYREFAETFLNSDIYSDLTDAERIKVLAMLNSYSEAEGIKAVYKDFETGNSTVQKMYAAEAEGISPEAYALWKVAKDKADKPNENGNMGTYTNSEKDEAIRILMKQYGIELTPTQRTSLKKKY